MNDREADRPAGNRGFFRSTAMLALVVGPVIGCSSGLAESQTESAAPAAQRLEVDLTHHFEPFAADGAFVLYEAASDRYVVHNAERAEQGFLPASTFKILNSLIALETGVLADEHEIIPWDGVDRGEWWNGDQPMTRAFQRSSFWFYQVVARRIGEARMRGWIERVGYGNASTEGGIDRFWLEGELRISALEQVELLRRLYHGTLPFSERSEAIVRRIMRMEEGDGYVLSGKTGWARQLDADPVTHTGWLVGWVERQGNTVFFATQIGGTGRDFPMRRAQQEITRGILRELGVLP